MRPRWIRPCIVTQIIVYTILNFQDISEMMFGDLPCYDCINNLRDPTEKLQIKMVINFPLDAPQYRMRKTPMSRSPI